MPILWRFFCSKGEGGNREKIEKFLILIFLPPNINNFPYFFSINIHKFYIWVKSCKSTEKKNLRGEGRGINEFFGKYMSLWCREQWRTSVRSVCIPRRTMWPSTTTSAPRISTATQSLCVKSAATILPPNRDGYILLIIIIPNVVIVQILSLEREDLY